MKIFISYTTRDHLIRPSLLRCIETIVSEFGEPYIDLIHNTAEDKQAHVENNLLKSDILILISSESVSKSNWVLWELKKAKLLGIPVIKISANEEDVPNIPTMLRIELNKLASN